MGVLARKQEQGWVITSDRDGEDKTKKRAAKKLSDTYLVWTGNHWSADMVEAKTFLDMDQADEYVRANYRAIMVDG
jgi:hypothetical protein